MAPHEAYLVAGLALIAGGAMPLGALFSRLEHLRPGHVREDTLHALIAFGGGALLAAVALVLVPKGAEVLPPAHMAAALGGGAILFLLLDLLIEKKGGQQGQLVAMLLDFLPESIALGAVFAGGAEGAALLAVLIALQNLPEGFNAHKDLVHAGSRPGRAVLVLVPLAFLGPAGALGGFFLLTDQPAVVAWMMLSASGGILYILFHDIAPLAHQRKHWVPTLGAVAGFLMGLVGQAILET